MSTELRSLLFTTMVTMMILIITMNEAEGRDKRRLRQYRPCKKQSIRETARGLLFVSNAVRPRGRMLYGQPPPSFVPSLMLATVDNRSGRLAETWGCSCSTGEQQRPREQLPVPRVAPACAAMAGRKRRTFPSCLGLKLSMRSTAAACPSRNNARLTDL